MMVDSGKIMDAMNVCLGKVNAKLVFNYCLLPIKFLLNYYFDKRTERHIHQAAAQRVQFPKTVMAACRVTSHSKDVGLSK